MPAARGRLAGIELVAKPAPSLFHQQITHSRVKETTVMKNHRRALIGLFAGVAAAGGVVASAASLGTVSSDSLGSGDVVVASCDTDGIALAYTTSYNAAAGTYRVTGVELSGVAAACDGLDLALTVRGAANASLAEATTTVSGTSQTVTVTPVAAESVLGVSVVITG